MAVLLVVEDDEKVRQLVSQVLSDAGHTVIEAADGLEATQICESRHVDVLVCDVMLPTLNGIEVLKSCRRSRPHATGILMSGHPVDELKARFKFPVGVALLEKPFSPKLLLRAVEQATTFN